MYDFLIPNNPASLIMLVIVLFLLWGTIKTEQKESILRAKTPPRGKRDPRNCG
ncbi:MAG: hypothetical protein LRY68_06925 [Sulfurospirillum sp.]|nr:hypothetical protein [Sulfurospirillum sp.]